MPTGYTADLVDDTIEVSFNQFAQTCMRAFGACVHMLDEPMNAPYRPREVTEWWRVKTIKKAEAELIALEAMSSVDIATYAYTAYQDELKTFKDGLRKEIRVGARIVKMIAHVKLWKPPTTEHIGFKKFMLDQLKVTYDQHCNYYTEKDLPVLVTSSDYHNERLKSVKCSLDYHKQKLDKEKDLIDDCSQWAEELLDSLPE